MAPEHASNGEADQRSDLFSMAIILWESLAGRRLFRAENHAATLNKICLEPIPLLSSADPSLAPFDDLLAKALARDPNDRFQSAEEFAEAVEEAAPLLGGLAKAREVAQLVREYAAEKVTHDAQLIRSAIALLAANGGASEPPPAYESIPPVVEMALQAPPMVMPSSAVPEVELADIGMEEIEGPSRKRWLWAALLMALAAVIGASAALLLSRHQGPSLQPASHVQMPEATEPQATGTTANAAPGSTGLQPSGTALQPAAAQSAATNHAAESPTPNQEPSHGTRESRHPRVEQVAPPAPEPERTADSPSAAPTPATPSTPPWRTRRIKDAEPAQRPSAPAEDLLPNPYH
jgi:serine/threonine-protein kinase